MPSGAEESGSERRESLLAAGIASLAWITFVPAQTFSSILMPTAWLVCAYWFCVSRLLRPAETSFWRPWLSYGLALGVISMLVATITFLLPLILLRLVLSVAQSRPWRERLPRTAAAIGILVIGLFAGCAPAWIHNYFIARDPVMLSAHSGVNIWMGNNPAATGYPKIPPGLRPTQEGLLKDSILWVEKIAGHPLKRSEVSLYWTAKAHDYIATHPWEWMGLLGRKLRNFWNAFEYDDLSVITLLQERGVLLPGLRWGLVAALGLTGLVFAVRTNVPARWVAAAVLLHMMAIMPVFVTERYRLAAAPGLIILGVYGLWRLWRSLPEREWGTAGAYSGVAVAAAFFVSWPVSDPDLRSLDPFNVGVKELDVAEIYLAQPGTPEERHAHREEAQKELASAAVHLQRAYAYVQGDPGIPFALGNLYLDRNEPERAKDFYRRTLALNPRFTSALNNLGYLALQEKDWPLAERYLVAATESDPENANSFYLLAQARQEQGNLDGARASAAQALRLKPTQAEFLRLSSELSSASPRTLPPNLNPNPNLTPAPAPAPPPRE